MNFAPKIEFFDILGFAGSLHLHVANAKSHLGYIFGSRTLVFLTKIRNGISVEIILSLILEFIGNPRGASMDFAFCPICGKIRRRMRTTSPTKGENGGGGVEDIRL